MDRDGTLIRDAHYLKDPQKLEIIPSAGPALKKAKDAGFLLFLHTNQSGIARGYYDWSDVYACNAKIFTSCSADFFSNALSMGLPVRTRPPFSPALRAVWGSIHLSPITQH